MQKQTNLTLSLVLTLCLSSVFSLRSQVNLEALYTVWQDQTQSDSIRVKAYSDYIWDGYLYSQPDSAFILAEELVSFGLDHHYARAQFAGYTLQGVSWVNRSDYQKTLDYYLRALNVAKRMGNSTALAIAHNNVGSIYHNEGDYTQALDHYIKSLEYNDPRQIGPTLNNIGTIYMNQNNYSKALEYCIRSLDLNRQKGDQGAVAATLTKMGAIYRELEDYSNSLDNYSQSLEIFQQLDHKTGIADTYNSLGLLYQRQGEYPKALDFHEKGLTYYEQLGDKNGMALSANNIGEIYLKQKDYNKALAYCQRGYDLSVSFHSLVRKRASCSCLYDTHKALGNGDKALLYLEQLNAVEDSLNSQETAKKLQQMEFQAEARTIQEAHEAEVRQKEKTKNISLIIGGFFLLLAGAFYIRWRYVRQSKASIQIEKERSENLLLNILPEEIARELKEKGKADARDFEMVSILFTDFKDFTEQGSRLSAAELVNEINSCFEAFDAIIEKYGIEKIKTIGDAYMAAGGLPVPSDDSVKNTVLAALEMQEFISKRKSEIGPGRKHAFEMRAGIHTGPVVAGIVGVKKFQYDIWGDTVNTASRVESSGQPGLVNISQTTYELLSDDPDLTFESRGKIEVKGKGEMEMYFVSKASV
ncbi:MAG: tetratricopeptide repeat protein [Lewinellaceae bacterium]|nr:tetratricopeptide repeat protein [Lewinellaceae bacterium]